MPDLKEIKESIEKLSSEDFEKLRRWIVEKHWGVWDKQIKEDSQAGKLDFLLEKAEKEFKERKLLDL